MVPWCLHHSHVLDLPPVLHCVEPDWRFRNSYSGCDGSYGIHVCMLYARLLHEVKRKSPENASKLSAELGLCTYLDEIFGSIWRVCTSFFSNTNFESLPFGLIARKFPTDQSALEFLFWILVLRIWQGISNTYSYFLNELEFCTVLLGSSSAIYVAEHWNQKMKKKIMKCNKECEE